MLVFVDESIQDGGAAKVGALGAVAIPTAKYNQFSSLLFRRKRARLGTDELDGDEIKATEFLSKGTFRRCEHDNTALQRLNTVREAVETMRGVGAVTFGVWTDRADQLTLRAGDVHELPRSYVVLLLRVAAYMRECHDSERALLFFDQLGHQADRQAACAVQNYLARTRKRAEWGKRVIQVPHFTHSAVSPGLQMADLMAYLSAQQAQVRRRQELLPFWKDFSDLAQYRVGAQVRRTVGSERVNPKLMDLPK